MSEEELAASRQEIEELRGKLRKLVPEWKNLKIVVQKLRASEAAAVARAEQLARAATLSPSSTSSASDDAAVLRAKLSKLVPEWKRLKEANRLLTESDSASLFKAQHLETQLDAANAELEMTREALRQAQERESEFQASYIELENTREAADKNQELKFEFDAANIERKRLMEATDNSQEVESRLAVVYAELEEATRKAQKFEAKLDAAYDELKKLPVATRKVQELESQLKVANIDRERIQEVIQESMKHSEQVARLEEQVEQQGGEITRLKKRLEKAMQRPTKLEFQKVKHENVQLHKRLSVEADVVRSLQNDIVESRSSYDQIVSLSNELADLQSRFSVCQASRDSLVIDGDKLEAENRMLHLQIDQLLQSNPEELNEIREHFKDSLREGKSLSVAIQDELTCLNDRYNSSIIEISNLNSALEEKTSELIAVQCKHDELLEQLQHLNSAVNEREFELIESRSKSEELLEQLRARSGIVQREDAVLKYEENGDLAESEQMDGLLTQAQDAIQIDSDKFHQYQNRIENLEEELLELTTSNAHLKQTLSFMKSELYSSQESIQPSSYDRSETDVLLQLLTQKDQLVEDLSSQLNQHRVLYLDKMFALKTTISSLRRHNQRLQTFIYSREFRPEGEVLKDENLKSRKRLRKADHQLERDSDSVDSDDESPRIQLEAAQTRIDEQNSVLHDAQTQIDELRCELESAQADNPNEFGLEDAKMRINEQTQKLKDAQTLIDELRCELESAQVRADDADQLDLEDAKTRISELTQELKDAQMLIDELRHELESVQAQTSDQNHLDLEDAKIRINELNQELKDARTQIDDLHRELENAQVQIDGQNQLEQNVAQKRFEDQNRELEDAQTQIDELYRKLQNAQMQIDQQNLELTSALARNEKQHCELESAQTRIDEQRLELEKTQSRIDEQNRELGAARSQIDKQLLELEASQNRFHGQCRVLEASQLQIDAKCREIEAAETQINEQYQELESTHSQIDEQNHELGAIQMQLEEQRKLGQAIVHNYNELKGHYEFLMAKLESESSMLEQITRSQSSKSFSPRKSTSSSTIDSSAFKSAVPARSASVPVKKRRTLKEFLVKLFERPIYDENGKPVSRVDLTEDTTFVWDPVKKKYIDLNSPEVEEKPISKPPPRPSFTPSPAPASSVPPGLGPPPRRPNRSMTASRYALPEGQSNSNVSPRRSSGVGSRYDPLEIASENLSKPSNAYPTSSATTCSNTIFYRPPVINSFDDVVVITADYHSLVASLLALQKELACVKRTKLETDLHVSTLVRQIKARLAKSPLEPTISDSLEFNKLVYCILAITGIVSAMTQI